MLNKINCKFDYVYDWTTPEENIGADENKIEFDSIINKKTTFTSYKNNENGDEEINKISLHSPIDSSKNNFVFNNNIKDDNEKLNEDEEEAIIFSKRKDYLNSIYNEEDVVCCTSSCILF